MTEAEFDLIAKLIRSRGPVRVAARLVLVSGYTTSGAAAAAGCSYNSVANTVARFKLTLKEIEAVFVRKALSA